jgi:asparagine synthase (glutamine-hydrolysing)
VATVSFDAPTVTRAPLLAGRACASNAAEDQPRVEPGLVVWFDGRLDNRDDLLASMPAVAGGQGASDAALVLAAYRAFGEGCVARLNGDFALALFDERRRVLLLARDIMAARPLFYAEVPDGMAFASECAQLLAHAKGAARIDRDGLADLVLNGYSDGRRTCFAGVHGVPPGAVVVATPDGVTTRQAWEFADLEIRYPRTSQYVEHFRALFSQAVRRRLRSAQPVAIAVSGGVDSSSIYCEAARLRGAAALHAVRLAFPKGSDADETPFVAALRARGLPVEDVRVDRVTWAMDASSQSADMPSLSWVEHETLLARVREAGCRVILNGFFGDQLLTGDAYLVDLARRGRLAPLRGHLRERASWMTDVDAAALRRRIGVAALRAVTPTAVLPAIRRLRGMPAVYPSWFTKEFRERAFEAAIARAGQPRRFRRAHAEECRRLATSGHYLAGLLQTCSLGRRFGIETAYPFRDRDLVQFVMSIPGEIANARGVPKALLRFATEGLVPEAIRLRRSKGDATAFTNAAARAAEASVAQLLGPESAAAGAGILDAAALRRAMPGLFGALGEDTAQPGWDIGDTLALELWLRRFFPGA